MNKDKELENSSYTKTFLMLLIVVYHSCVFWTGTWFTGNPLQESNVMKNIALWLNSFHVYAFFIVSGYIYFYTRHERNNYMGFSSFIKKKVKRLIIPYVFFAIVWVVPVSAFFMELSAIDIVNKYLLGIAPNQLWFLLALFIIFTVSYLTSNWWIKHSLIMFFIALGFYLVGIVLDGKIDNYFQIISSFRSFLFFYIGFFIRYRQHDILYKINYLVYLSLSVSLFVLYRILLIYNHSLLVHPIELLLRVVGAVGAFVSFQMLSEKVKHLYVFVLLCDQSMRIYLIHQQIVYFVIFILNGVIHPMLIAIVAFFLSLSFSYLISKVLCKFKVARMLSGG